MPLVCHQYVDQTLKFRTEMVRYRYTEKIRFQKSRVKIMLSIFKLSDSNGQKVAQKYYLDVYLTEFCSQKSLYLYVVKNSLFHQFLDSEKYCNYPPICIIWFPVPKELFSRIFPRLKQRFKSLLKYWLPFWTCIVFLFFFFLLWTKEMVWKLVYTKQYSWNSKLVKIKGPNVCKLTKSSSIFDWLITYSKYITRKIVYHRVQRIWDTYSRYSRD